MMTPQDVQEKEFVKAVFGGYDMASVDDFLEQVSEDYAALYKEAAVLKGKLKVLVEKVEEYRSTEDSMRMALLTAQKMGNEIVEEAKKKSESIVAEANEKAKNIQEELNVKLAEEQETLRQAQRETADFSQHILDLYQNQIAFIKELTSLAVSADLEAALSDAAGAPAQAEGKAAKAFSPSDVLNTSVESLIEGAKSRAQAQMDTQDSDAAQPGDESVDIAKSISESLGDDTQFSADPDTVWEDEDEPTTKRPKFDFDDLKFGENFSDQE